MPCGRRRRAECASVHLPVWSGHVKYSRLLELRILQIEIAIGIGIVSIATVCRGFFSYLVSPSTQTAKHRSHAIEFPLVVLALCFVKCLANNQNILNCSALQRLAAGNLEIPPPIRLSSLPVALGNVQRDRLAGAQPLIARCPMDSVEPLGLCVNPCNVTD